MSEISTWELDAEISEAGERHNFWPDLIQNYQYERLLSETPEAREELYIQQAEDQRKALLKFEETKKCEAFVLRFGHGHGARMLFQSPWSRRFRACPDYVEAAGSVWVQAYTLWAHRRHWLRFFDRRKEEVRRLWMNEDDVSVLATIPKPFTLFRGYNKPLGKMGLSWTLEKRIADKISYGRGTNSWIITATANPEDVIAYTDQRLEREVIIDPKKVVVVNEEPAEESIRVAKSMPSSEVGAKSPESSFLSQLKLMEIVRLGNGAAQINGRIFKVGDQKQVSIDEHEMKIHCLEIREKSVLVIVEGVKETQELWLPDSKRRWKSYSG